MSAPMSDEEFADEVGDQVTPLGGDIEHAADAAGEDSIDTDFPPLTMEEEAAFLSWAQAHQNGFVPSEGGSPQPEEEEETKHAADDEPSSHPPASVPVSHRSTRSQQQDGAPILQTAARSVASSQRGSSRTSAAQPTRSSTSFGAGFHSSTGGGGGEVHVKDRKWLAQQHDIAAANAMLLGRLLAIGQGDRVYYDPTHGAKPEGAGVMRRKYTWNDPYTASHVQHRAIIMRAASEKARARRNATIDAENLRMQKRLQATKHSPVFDHDAMAATYARHKQYRDLRSHFKPAATVPASAAAADSYASTSSGTHSPERYVHTFDSLPAVSRSHGGGGGGSPTRYSSRQKERLYASSSAPNLAGGTIRGSPREAVARTHHLLQQERRSRLTEPDVDRDDGEQQDHDLDESKEQLHDTADHARRDAPRAGRRGAHPKPMIAAQSLSSALTPESVAQLMEGVFFSDSPQLARPTRVRQANTPAPVAAPVTVIATSPAAAAAVAAYSPATPQPHHRQASYARSPQVVEKPARLTPLKVQSRNGAVTHSSPKPTPTTAFGSSVSPQKSRSTSSSTQQKTRSTATSPAKRGASPTRAKNPPKAKARAPLRVSASTPALRGGQTLAPIRGKSKKKSKGDAPPPPPPAVGASVATQTIEDELRPEPEAEQLDDFDFLPEPEAGAPNDVDDSVADYGFLPEPVAGAPMELDETTQPLRRASLQTTLLATDIDSQDASSDMIPDVEPTVDPLDATNASDLAGADARDDDDPPIHKHRLVTHATPDIFNDLDADESEPTSQPPPRKQSVPTMTEEQPPTELAEPITTTTTIEPPQADLQPDDDVGPESNKDQADADATGADDENGADFGANDAPGADAGADVDADVAAHADADVDANADGIADADADAADADAVDEADADADADAAADAGAGVEATDADAADEADTADVDVGADSGADVNASDELDSSDVPADAAPADDLPAADDEAPDEAPDDSLPPHTSHAEPLADTDSPLPEAEEDANAPDDDDSPPLAPDQEEEAEPEGDAEADEEA